MSRSLLSGQGFAKKVVADDIVSDKSPRNKKMTILENRKFTFFSQVIGLKEGSTWR